MKTKDVVNNMLSTIGYFPLNELDEDNEFTANALRIIDQQNEFVQGNGYWFNTEEIDLYPDLNNPERLTEFMIKTPADAIRCDPVKKYNYPIVQRGDRLYDTSANTYYFARNSVITCTLIRLIPFEDLPPTAQNVVNLASVIKFQQNYDADRQKADAIRQEYSMAIAQLNAEDIRNSKSNLLYTNSTLRQLRGIGNFGRFY